MRRDRDIQKDNTIVMVVVVVKLAIKKYDASWLLISAYTYRYLQTLLNLCNFDLLPFQFIAKEASSLQEKISSSRINL